MALVVLQAGHCFRTRGATGTGGIDAEPTEQEFAWLAANRAAFRLRQAGHHTRVILADVPDSDYRGDAFVAIHCDGSTSPSAHGASVGYRNSNGQRFAEAWKRAYARRGWSGFRPDNYTPALAGYYGTGIAVRQGNSFAFIAEAGFLTNPSDEQQLTPPGGTDRFALAVVDAVNELFGGSSVEEDDLPYSEDQLRGIVRSVLDEGTAFGYTTWAETNRGLIDLGRKTYNNVVAGEEADKEQAAEILAAVAVQLDPAAVAAAIPENIAREVVDALAARLGDE